MDEFIDVLISRVEEKLPALDVKVQTERLEKGRPIELNPTLVETVRRYAKEYDVLEMWSGAGHDAAYMNDICRKGAVVFFIPNTGVSHEPSESSSIEDIALATQLVLKIFTEK